jgi:hypothetical protein
MPSVKPTLALTTPVTASFPADALKSAAYSARTPMSASWREPLPSAGLPSAGLPSAGLTSPFVPVKTEDGKTPITPPMAYMDFLKSMSLASPSMPSPGIASPPLTGKAPLSRTSTGSSNTSTKSATSSISNQTIEEDREEKDGESAPSTATSDATDCDCDCDRVHKSPKAAVPPSPFANYPLSAPATGPTTFSSLKVPPSPAAGNLDSPIRSPFSARSVRSPFDWDAALKARRYAEANKPAVGPAHSCTKGASRSNVRHIREVVTRTVTYTPRMDPAPKGKRRKVE